jgi:hypothetical protein
LQGFQAALAIILAAELWRMRQQDFQRQRSPLETSSVTEGVRQSRADAANEGNHQQARKRAA